MTKEQLFRKYNIKKSHSEWDNKIDNWMSVKIFRIMHYGRLPNKKDVSFKYILDFADKKDSDFKWWIDEIMQRKDWGSLYLTSRRMIYRYSDELIKIKNEN